MNPALFTPFTLRDITFRNRIAVSPMCQYSCHDGFVNDWHLVHLGSRAVGGAALVIVEASAVTPEGRISPADAGIWKDEHIEPLARIARFVRQHEAMAGIQLAHAGRKASTAEPWMGGHPVLPAQGGWEPAAPSAVPFRSADPAPHELSKAEIQAATKAFVAATKRAYAAGFQVVEIHGAHGYLIHEFLSPLSNQRTDEYGGSFENRTRFALETIEAVRTSWPSSLPLFLRISATDWTEGGWDIDQSVEFARKVKPLGVDLIDCSSGGLAVQQQIPVAPGYQVPFAARIREEANIPTAAVGLITDAHQAEQIIAGGEADMILLAREFLRDPYFPLRAARALGTSIDPPKQYLRAW